MNLLLNHFLIFKDICDKEEKHDKGFEIKLFSSRNSKEGALFDENGYDSEWVKILNEDKDKDEVVARAFWSGSYPNLCSGYWRLGFNGIDVTDKIPKDMINNEMDVYNLYRFL